MRALEPTDADLGLFAACFSRNDSPRTLAALRWQYLDNPTGKLLVDVVDAGSGADARLAAIYAVLPVPVVVDGKPSIGVQSLDTLTDADFRGRGLFLKLAKSTYERAAREGAAFVYGFPNGNSAHGFFSRLEWVRLDPVPFLVRPLRTRYLLRRLGERLGALPDVTLPSRLPSPPDDQELRAVRRFDERHEAIWRANARHIGVAVDRSAAYLNWRLRDKPGEDYRVLALHERGELLGFVAHCLKEKHGGRIGYVLELLHRPDRSDAGVQLLRAAVDDLARRGADLALAWNLPHSPNHAAFGGAGFVPFPERLRPVELHFGARRLALPDSVAVGNRARWYLSYCDSDTV